MLKVLKKYFKRSLKVLVRGWHISSSRSSYVVFSYSSYVFFFLFFIYVLSFCSSYTSHMFTAVICAVNIRWRMFYISSSMSLFISISSSFLCSPSFHHLLFVGLRHLFPLFILVFIVLISLQINHHSPVIFSHLLSSSYTLTVLIVLPMLN